VSTTSCGSWHRDSPTPAWPGGWYCERTVEAHVRRLLGKLDIEDGDDANRRVLAVLAYLRAG
jgi:hypothetical protein